MKQKKSSSKVLYVIKTTGNKYLFDNRHTTPKFTKDWWTRRYFNTEDDANWFMNLINKGLGTTAFLEDITAAEAKKMKVVKVVRTIRA